MVDAATVPSDAHSDPKLDLVASAIAKNTWRLVPLLGLAYLFNYLDRTSVGFAALQMNKAIGLSATQFGWGAGILFLSYCLLEVPSNLMMYRFGARRWLVVDQVGLDLLVFVEEGIHIDHQVTHNRKA